MRLRYNYIYSSVLLLAGLLFVTPADAQTTSETNGLTSDAPVLSGIERVLSDNAGLTGDAAAFRNLKERQLTSRRLSASQSSDARWSSSFGRPGLDLVGTSVAIDGDDVYVGGIFFAAGETEANSIAVWNANTQTWSALGEGLSDDDFGYGIVWDVAIDDNKLYVVGNFDTAGGAPASNIAVWDIAAQEWSTFEDGLNGPANTVSASGGNVFVGGSFDSVGTAGSATLEVNNVARWNGSSWHSLGSGVDADVHSLVVLNNELYAGGDFSTAGGNTANNIAKWNGTSWSALVDDDGDNGTDGIIQEMETAGDSVLYVGGGFAQAGGEAIGAVAKWSPAANRFSSLGPGVNNSSGSATVMSIAVEGNDVYVAGAFDATGISNAQQIARWDVDAESWSPLGDGLAAVDPLHTGLEAGGGTVYVAGFMYGAGNQPVQGVAAWDGSAWSALDTPVNNHGLAGLDGFGVGAVTAISSVDNGIVAGGIFRMAGDQFVSGIARWDPSMEEWFALGEGLSSSNGSPVAFAIAEDGDNVYVGGQFTEAGTTPASNIAVWDRSSESWSALGDGVDDNVRDILILDGTVYVAGSFTTAGGTTVNNIASWNGSSWNALDSGVNGDVRALAAIGGELYVGGNFTTAGGITANNVARWNGTSWSALVDGGSNGTNDVVVSLHVASSDSLILGGEFNSAGSVSASAIATWNPGAQTFSSIGPGFNNTVHALASHEDTLYASGQFTSSGISNISAVAKWDGSNWQPLGSGTNSSPFNTGTLAMGVDQTNEDLYVGGLFTQAGGKVSTGIAQYDLSPASGVAVDDPVAHSFALQGNTPNPVSERATIRYSLAEPAAVTLTVYDVVGRRVVTIIDGEQQSVGPHDVDVNVRSLPAGVYFYRLTAGGRQDTRAMTVVR